VLSLSGKDALAPPSSLLNPPTLSSRFRSHHRFRPMLTVDHSQEDNCRKSRHRFETCQLSSARILLDVGHSWLNAFVLMPLIVEIAIIQLAVLELQRVEQIRQASRPRGGEFRFFIWLGFTYAVRLRSARNSRERSCCASQRIGMSS
jgi:hypothetical protein